MKILVTGGAGFIGSQVARAYAEAGHEVLVVDDLSSGHRANVPATVRFEQLDIRSVEAARLLEAERPEVLSHHAAQMNVRVSVDNPRLDADVNVVGFINLLEAGRRAGLQRVVFASSGGTVYGDGDKLPYTEKQPTRPVCPYGVSKLAGEQYLYYYSRVCGMRYTALRYANVYGPFQDPHGEAGVVAIFAQKMLRGEEITMFGDGLQTRDYVFVGDVVAANLACLDSDFCGSLNIGTGQETNVVELYELLRACTDIEVRALHGPAKQGEVRRSALDASLARDVLGWFPRTRLADGLAATVDFFRSRS